MAEVLVVGASGALGHHVCALLASRGHSPRGLSRSGTPPPGGRGLRGDLATGEGLAEALQGVDVVVHCARSLGRSHEELEQVDVQGTRRLADAAVDAGVGHLVYPSIVGIDEDPFRVYRAKLRAEQELERSGAPVTIVRLTHFHELVVEVLRVAVRAPIVAVPRGWRVQPIAARDAAAHVVGLLDGPSRGRAEDFGGPQVLGSKELARAYLAARRRRRPVVEVPMPGRTPRFFRAGAHTCPERAIEGGTTFADYAASAAG